MRTVTWLVLLCMGASGGLAAERWIPVDDVDEWEAKAFCGSPTVRWFLQGPKFEGGASGVVAVDSKGTVYVACGTFIQEVKGGVARILTGAPGITGNTDGPPGQATFGNVMDIVLANDDLIYAPDAANFTLRKIELKGGVWITSTVAGMPRVKGHQDGRGREVRFTNPFESVVATEDGVVYLCDGDWLRKVENGVVTTLNAGHGYVNGPLKEAKFARSQGRRSGLAYDGKGNLYLADKVNMAIRKIDLTKGQVTTIAGVLPGVARERPRDGEALEARFHPGGGPNVAFFNRVFDFLLVRSDDEQGTRAIAKGWVKTFGGVPGRRKKHIGLWRDVSSGSPVGVDRWGNTYFTGPGGTIRIVGKKRVKTPPADAPPPKVARAAWQGLSWPQEPGGFGDLKAIAPRLSLGREILLPRGTLLHQRHPAVAFGDGVYLVVWQEGFNGLGHDSNIVGLRLAADGKPIDKTAFPICVVRGVQDAPAVAYVGGGFLVAWSDYRMGVDADVYGCLVSGNPAEKRKRVEIPIAVGKGGQANPAVASDGKGQTLVAWQDYRSGEYFGIYGARFEVRSGKSLDPKGLEILGRGEQPVVAWSGTRYLVCQKYYGATVDPDGKVSETHKLYASSSCNPPAVAVAWGKVHAFLNMITGPDPWGWGGNGHVVGIRVGQNGETMEPRTKGRLKSHSSQGADGKVANFVDTARWRNHHGWPMGMPGGFKNTHEGTWPSGPPAAAYNGISLVAVWPRARLMDRRRLADRDLYLCRTYDGWGFVDRYKIKIAGGPTEENNPVLCAGKPGDLLLAYEKVEPSGVGIVYRIVRETPDTRGPQVAWTAPLSDTNMIVAFDEPIDPVSAAQAGNYAIKGVAVADVTFVSDPRAGQREVILETGPQARGKTYALLVKGVKDRSNAANVSSGQRFETIAKPGTFERSEFIAQWAVKGPFDRDWTKMPVDPGAVHPTPGQDDWKTASCSGGVVLDFRRWFGKLEGKSAVANTYVYSDRERDVIVRIDSNDDHRLWLNGKLISADLLPPSRGRGLHDYTNEVDARLKKGWNQVMIQVANYIGKWQLAMQITDGAKHPIPDLTWQLESPFARGERE